MPQTNQTEASMNNQYNCCLLVRTRRYMLTFSKLSWASWRRNSYHFALFHAGLRSRELKLWCNISFFPEMCFRIWISIIEVPTESLKPAKTLPWSETSQRCLLFGEVALLTGRITCKSLVCSLTLRIAPCCVTLGYDQRNWTTINYGRLVMNENTDEFWNFFLVACKSNKIFLFVSLKC